jgi:NTP pyrophosphatase (non-canonical NTP hydrolase)
MRTHNMKKIDLNAYQDFVKAVTSKPSNDLTSFMDRCEDLDANYLTETDEHGPDIIVPLLLTGAMGLCSEAGEFMEIVKKSLFQGKEISTEVHWHMKRELGDVIWYWMNACRALHLDPNDVIAENVHKLEARYPGGTFDPFYSENRKVGDL